jgi:hypothetical protein
MHKHITRSHARSLLLAALSFVLLSIAACRADDASKQEAQPAPTQNSPSGPQAPHDSMVVEALRPCMAVGRVFAKMPPADRLEEVVDACAPALRPPCRAALVRLAQPGEPNDNPAQSLPAQALAVCASSYCPDLTPGSASAALCASLATASDPQRLPKNAEIMAFFEAALRLDHPAQAQGIEILSGMLLSVILDAKPPGSAAP